ncbi:MAG: hypothetical protein GMKNLPBB_02507 [Myxococcota bacterium]|nr:hypothetical protein [Myxococcota bacterium]
MLFKTQYTFACSLEQFQQAVLHPELDAYIERRLQSIERRHVLEIRPEGDVIVKRVRCLPAVEIPRPLQPFVSPAMMEWEEEIIINPSRGWSEFRAAPLRFREYSSTHGCAIAQPVPGGVQRTLMAAISIHIPVFGALFSRFVEDRVAASLDEEARVFASFIAQRITSGETALRN